MSGGQHQADDVTVDELLAAWLERVAPDLSPTTVAGYRSNVALHVRPTIGNVRGLVVTGL